MENSRKVGGFVCFSSLLLAVFKQAIETEFRLECPSSRGAGQYSMAPRGRICPELAADGQNTLS